MSEKHYAAGDVIFKEGEPSHTVCRIKSGKVEVLKDVDGWPIVLGTVGAGEYVGEMGVIERKPRGATVRAETDVEVEILDEDRFLRRISEDHGMSLEIIERLSARLRATNQLILDLETASASVVSDESESAIDTATDMAIDTGFGSGTSLPAIASTITILADSDAVVDSIPPGGIEVSEVPFHVGREPGKGERRPACDLGLTLEDEEPFRLSRVHFSIVRIRDGFMVSDASSTLGTLVNGDFIGQYAPKVFAKLEPGENRIVAGGFDSPFAFRAIVSGPPPSDS